MNSQVYKDVSGQLAYEEKVKNSYSRTSDRINSFHSLELGPDSTFGNYMSNRAGRTSTLNANELDKISEGSANRFARASQLSG